MPWSDTDLAYLAGLIDGEGSICIFHSTGITKGKRYGRLRLILNIYNNHYDTLSWVHNMFGGTLRRVSRNREEWTTSYVWQTGWQNAAIILVSCRPYLKIKKQQADLFIECAATSKHGATPTNIFVRRNEIVAQIKLLNARGPSDAVGHA